MRSPSARVLINRVNIFQSMSARDNDGGPQYPYPSKPTYLNQACTVQPIGAAEVEDQGRITMIRSYKIMFGVPIALNPRDKIVWVDNVGNTRNIFVQANRDEAGRGAAFTVYAEERV